jgi:hypothetical protein
MGENTEMTGKDQNPTERMQQDIRHTEEEIRKTVHTIEDRLSPSNLKRQAMRKAKHYLFKGIADSIGFVQRKPMQTALAGTGALLLLARRKNPRSKQRTATRMEIAGTAAKAFVSGATGRKSKDASKSGKRIIWRGIATVLGAAASTLWAQRKQEPRRPAVMASPDYELPRAGGYPGINRDLLEHSP